MALHCNFRIVKIYEALIGPGPLNQALGYSLMSLVLNLGLPVSHRFSTLK